MITYEAENDKANFVTQKIEIELNKPSRLLVRRSRSGRCLMGVFAGWLPVSTRGLARFFTIVLISLLNSLAQRLIRLDEDVNLQVGDRAAQPANPPDPSQPARRSSYGPDPQPWPPGASRPGRNCRSASTPHRPCRSGKPSRCAGFRFRSRSPKWSP